VYRKKLRKSSQEQQAHSPLKKKSGNFEKNEKSSPPETIYLTLINHISSTYDLYNFVLMNESDSVSQVSDFRTLGPLVSLGKKIS